MQQKYHSLVLGVLEDIPQGLELYQELISDEFDLRHPIILSHFTVGDHEHSLQHAGLVENRSIDGMRIYHSINRTVNSVDKPFDPQALVTNFIDDNPDLFRSLFNDYLCKGKILVALDIEGMEDTEIRLTKLILHHAIDRVFLIDLV